MSSKHPKVHQYVHFLEVGQVQLFRPGYTPDITVKRSCCRRWGKWRQRRRARVFKSASTFERKKVCEKRPASFLALLDHWSAIFQIRKFQSDPQLSQPCRSFQPNHFDKAKAEHADPSCVSYAAQNIRYYSETYTSMGPLFINWFGSGWFCIPILSSRVRPFTASPWNWDSIQMKFCRTRLGFGHLLHTMVGVCFAFMARFFAVLIEGFMRIGILEAHKCR